MSYHFSQALLEEALEADFLDGEQYAELSGNRTAERLSFDGKKKGSSKSFPSMETSVALMALSGVEKWISSLPDSLASPSPLLAGEQERETRGICGPKLSVSFARLDPPIASSKTSRDSSLLGSVSVSAASPIQKYRSYIQKDGIAKDGKKRNQKTDQNCPRGHVLIVAQEWVMPQLNLFTTSERYCETWRKAGMMLNGVCYLQPNAELPIGEVGSGFLPTPNPVSYGTNQGGAAGRVGKIRPSLQTLAKHNLWRIPHASDGEGGVMKMHKDKDGHYKLRDHVQDINREMWPTPAGRDGRSGKASEQTMGKNARPLNEVVVSGEKSSARKAWPTPTRNDGLGAGYQKGKGNVDFPTLPGAVGGAPIPPDKIISGAGSDGMQAPQTYPTPTDSMVTMADMEQARYAGSDPQRPSYQEAKKTWHTPESHPRTHSPRNCGHGTIPLANQCGGQLNPDWVAWLMGWPVGWTSMEPLDKEHFAAWLEAIHGGWWWLEDPADLGIVPRVSQGVPHRVNRLKALGNGQVALCMAVAWWLLFPGWIKEV